VSPRGIPKPSGACERVGCYATATHLVRGWHNDGFGFRAWHLRACPSHADEYRDAVNTGRNGATVTAIEQSADGA